MVNMENYEEYMLLEADSELNDAERKALYAFLEKHPELKKELDAYKAAHLSPTVDIIYPDKESLLKKEAKGKVIGIGKRWMYAAAAAAIVVLFVSIYNRQQHIQEPMMAKTDVKPEPKEIITQPADSPAVQVPPRQEEELHSKPASPITNIAKKQAKKTPVPVEPVKQREPIRVIQPQKEEVIVKKEQGQIKPDIEKPKTHGDPAPESQVEELIKEYVAKSEEPVSPERKGLLASLPVREEKMQGLADISDAVGERVEQVKAIKDKIKDSDISFKLGKRELFVVRL